MTKAIVLDTETTDSKNPQVVELAWRTYTIEPTGYGEQYIGRFSHTQAMTWGALATHHILPSELVGLQPSSAAPGCIPQVDYWIGHNVDFDWKALGSPPVKRICTLAMCRAIWPKLDSHKLGAMMYYLYGPNESTRELVVTGHGAMADVIMCQMILERILSDSGTGLRTFAQLYEFSEDCRIPKIMTFGKYKDQPIEAVDKGWANWYARQEDTDPYLIAALKRARKL